MAKPNAAEPEPKKLCGGIAEPPRNPPNPPLSKGGEGGFLEFVANLRFNFVVASYFVSTLHSSVFACLAL